jgi:hypothetical protein
MGKLTLLSVGTNAKTVKGDGDETGYLTAILYMAPHKGNTHGVNLCPKATVGCAAACLNTAGRGAFSNVQKARIRKADWFISDRPAFLKQLHHELIMFSSYARRKNLKPVVRLNGTTDILWEKHLDMTKYPEIQFYDYTKWAPIQRANLPFNYHLTYSRAENWASHILQLRVNNGANVAVVFDKVPEEYEGFPVFNGDDNDLRFLDPKGHVIGLSAKGKAKKDTSGFVVRSV